MHIYACFNLNMDYVLERLSHIKDDLTNLRDEVDRHDSLNYYQACEAKVKINALLKEEQILLNYLETYKPDCNK